MPSAIAKVNDQVIAESDATVFVEGNHYFPEADVHMDMLTPTDLETVCHWKGSANYYTVNAESGPLENAAWTYHEPKTAQAEALKDMIAFYSDKVTVEVR